MAKEEREKAIEELKKAIDTALEALKQEPCEDAISRKALMSHIENEGREWGEDYDLEQLLGDIEDFPSVTPTQKRGSWIERFNEDERWLMCTECRGDSDKAYNFCPKCGAHMEGVDVNG